MTTAGSGPCSQRPVLPAQVALVGGALQLICGLVALCRWHAWLLQFFPKVRLCRVDGYDAKPMGCMSMTGFGSATLDRAGLRYDVQLRTVNHRYFDLRMLLPDEAQIAAPLVERLLRKHLLRGRCELRLRITASGEHQGVDLPFARAAYRSLCQLRDELAPEQTVPIAAVAAIPATFAAGEVYLEAVAEDAVVACAEVALGDLLREREREGQALAEDLRSLCAAANSSAQALQDLAGDAVATSRKRLRERLARLLEGQELDPQRLEQEVVLLADKSDIHEELARLSAHLEQLQALLNGSGTADSQGRKLDFMIQELAREANTMASKSSTTELTHAVVELKSCIERMRQQCQNLE